MKNLANLFSFALRLRSSASLRCRNSSLISSNLGMVHFMLYLSEAKSSTLKSYLRSITSAVG